MILDKEGGRHVIIPFFVRVWPRSLVLSGGGSRVVASAVGARITGLCHPALFDGEGFGIYVVLLKAVIQVLVVQREAGAILEVEVIVAGAQFVVERPLLTCRSEP